MSNTAEKAKSSPSHQSAASMHVAKHNLTDKDIVEEVEKKPEQSSAVTQVI